MGILTTLFEGVGGIVGPFITMIGNALSGVLDIFYTAGVDGAAGELTAFGWLVLIPVAGALVFWALGLVRSLITNIRARRAAK